MDLGHAAPRDLRVAPVLGKIRSVQGKHCEHGSMMLSYLGNVESALMNLSDGKRNH